jgi:MFS family permease
VLIPFYLQNLMGFTPTQMGWILIGGSAVIIVLAPVAGRLSDRFGSRVLCSVGAAIMIMGQYLIGSLTLRSTVFQMILPQLLIGLGWALFNSPNQSAIMSTVPRDKVGAASGMTLTTARIGGAMGIAISRTIMTYALIAASHRTGRIAGELGASPEVFLGVQLHHPFDRATILSIVFSPCAVLSK